jgi:hypothetical protein
MTPAEASEGGEPSQTLSIALLADSDGGEDWSAAARRAVKTPPAGDQVSEFCTYTREELVQFPPRS